MRAMTRPPLEPDPATLDSWMAAVAAFVGEHVRTLPDQPSSDLEGAEADRRRFREPAPEEGTPLPALLERLRPAVARSFNTAGPGYLAFIPGGGVIAAALADFLALAVNRYMGVARAAPVLHEIEVTTIRWLAGMMGYPAGARGILTSGGSLSNLVALITARCERLPADFLGGTIYLSEETHLSVTKAARLAGFPPRRVRPIPVDARFRLVPEALEAAIEEDRASGLHPFLVVANVGTTNTGAVDPLPVILEIAGRRGLWVHADAAYGGFFRIAPGGEALMPGLERCDSITLDPHQGLFLPYGTGCLLVRDGEALRRAHEGSAHYLQDVAAGEEETVNFTDLSPELSRDFRGLRLWLPLQLHGVASFREQLREKLELAREAAALLAADGRFELLDAPPQLSIVAFRRRGWDDAAQAELLRRVNGRRRVFLSSTTMGGRFVLRICVLSFRTHRDRVLDAVTALREEAGA
jgi:aromatic-L-amino-acid decarboxylase